MQRHVNSLLQMFHHFMHINFVAKASMLPQISSRTKTYERPCLQARQPKHNSREEGLKNILLASMAHAILFRACLAHQDGVACLPAPFRDCNLQDSVKNFDLISDRPSNGIPQSPYAGLGAQALSAPSRGGGKGGGELLVSHPPMHTKQSKQCSKSFGLGHSPVYKVRKGLLLT